MFPELNQAMLCAWMYQSIWKDNKNQNASYSGSSKRKPRLHNVFVKESNKLPLPGESQLKCC